MGIFDFLEKNIGIDAGSENLRVIENDNLIFDQKSILSVDTTTGIVSGIGKSIKSIDNHKTIKPVNYCISDFQAFEELIKTAIKEGFKQTGIFHPSLISYFCIPSAISEVEKRAIRDSAEFSGSKKVFMLNSAITSSINLNILFEKKHFILIEFGASKFEINVFADSIIVSTGFIRLGTWHLHKLIKNYVYRKTKKLIDENKIEKILNQINSIDDENNNLLNQIFIDNKALEVILNSYLIIINDEIQSTLEKIVNNTNYNKIILNGAYFTGGGSYNRLLIDKIDFGIETKKQISSTPLLDNIYGLNKVINNPKLYKDYIYQ